MRRRVRFEESIDWHVFNRGSRRMALFRDDQDARVFAALLQTGLEVSGCVLWAYVLMTNHFHLAIRGSSAQLRRCMHYVEWLYSLYHNKRYGLSGAAFEGRYEAYPQGTLPMLLRTIAYVLMNPVAAGLVESPDAYSWSNYGAFFGGTPSLLSGDADLFLDRFDPDPSLSQARLLTFMDRERARILRGDHRPGMSAKDVQANHFDWLLEEASTRKAITEVFNPLTLALYWAKEAGFHRGAIHRVLGGPMSSHQRNQLSRLRRWLSDDPARAELAALP
ncbi:MAG TPA: transposase [Planctomycetota bacterium]